MKKREEHIVAATRYEERLKIRRNLKKSDTFKYHELIQYVHYAFRAGIRWQMNRENETKTK